MQDIWNDLQAKAEAVSARPIISLFDDNAQRFSQFSAAHDGCLECVRRLIEDDGIPADAQSVSGNFNVLEWAKHGGHQPVIDYVQNLAK